MPIVKAGSENMRPERGVAAAAVTHVNTAYILNNSTHILFVMFMAMIFHNSKIYLFGHTLKIMFLKIMRTSKI